MEICKGVLIFLAMMPQYLGKYSQYSFSIYHGSVIFVLLTICLSTCNTILGTERSKLIVAFQAPCNISHPLSAQRLTSAFETAINKVNADPSYLYYYKLEYVYGDCSCDAKKSLQTFISQVQKENISALFGPVCSEAAEVQYVIILFSDYAGFYLIFISQQPVILGFILIFLEMLWDFLFIFLTYPFRYIPFHSTTCLNFL